MAVLHVSATGTKTSGTSTPGDYTDSQCYPATATGIANAMGAASDGDTVIFDSGTYDSPDWSLNAAPTGRIAIESRSGNTIMRPSSGSTRLWTYGSGTAASGFIFSDLIFDFEPFAWTPEGVAPIQITQNCDYVEMNGCTWRNLVYAGVARTTGLAMRVAPNIAGVTVLIVDALLDEITATCSGDFGGLFRVEDNDITWTVTRPRFRNSSIACTAGNNLGLIYQTNTTPLTIEDAELRDLTLSNSNGSGSVAGLYRAQGTPGVFTLDGLTVESVTMNGLASTEGIVKIIGTGSVTRARVNELRRTGMTAGSNGNSVGGVVSAQGASAAATVTDMQVRNSGGFFGTAFYNSGGATIVAEGVLAQNINDGGQVGQGGDPVNGQAFYSGGQGDSTWIGCVAQNCTGSAENGLAAYAHNPQRDENLSKTHKMYNCTFRDTPSTASQPALMLRSDEPDGTFTVDIDNCLFDNGVNEMEVIEGAGTLNLTMATSHVVEGSGAISTTITNGSASLGSPTSGAVTYDDDGAPVNDSLKTGATALTEAPVIGADGEPFPAYGISIGGIQSRNVAGHPTQL